jgi:hypothetical protein
VYIVTASVAFLSLTPQELPELCGCSVGYPLRMRQRYLCRKSRDSVERSIETRALLK